jgi:hypothetical protein
MSNVTHERMIVSFQAEHVTTALEAARSNPDEFRREQLRWLSAEHPKRHDFVVVLHEKMLRGGSATQEMAGPVLMGSVLGDGAVRACVASTGTAYGLLRNNYWRNADAVLAARDTTPDTSYALWESRDLLTEAFGDESIVDVLVTIKHSLSRDAAALTIANYCLKDVPLT